MSMSGAPAESWSPARRIAFRFAFAYLILYGIDAYLNLLPEGLPLAEVYQKPWQALVPWVGKHILHLSQDIAVGPATGSGDTMFHYVELFCHAALVTVATVVWSTADARRAEYARLYGFLRVYVRYALAVTMVSYGMFKVIKTQFPSPPLERLLQPFGELSPMRLLWNFMGYSTPYTIFAGAGEVLGGALLFFRRTTTLGALVVASVMSNVVILNFSYDVPVKLFSSHLLLMAVFLLIPDLPRLANLFLRNRPTTKAEERQPFKALWMERGRLVLKVLFIGAAVLLPARECLLAREMRAAKNSAPLLYGVYEVEAFSRNGESVPPLLTDETRWRRVIINEVGILSIQRMNDSMQRLLLTDDPAKLTITLSDGEDQSPKIVLAYSRPDPEHLIMKGDFMNNAVDVRLRKLDKSAFLLVNRGFHWISEEPYNR